MNNIIQAINFGQSEKAKGIPFGKGLEKISLHVNGVQNGKMYGVAGPQKSGKSTFADYAFVLSVYLYALENNLEVEWIYYSFEISRVNKEIDFMTFFLNHDYGIDKIKLPDGRKRKGKDYIELSPDYLKGILMDDEYKPIKLDPNVYAKMKIVYDTRIVPLFGEYDELGNRIKKGLIDFKEGKDNPTGVYKDLVEYAEKNGRFTKDSKGRWIGYTPKKEGVLRIVVIDHLRKLKLERGWQMKQTIDKMSEYLVILRNIIGFTLVPILHTNRNLTSGDRTRVLGQNIYPSSDDLKDSGNLAEDCDYLFTVFNPNDDKYSLKEHFGFKIKDSKNNTLFPNLRTIHLVESRHCDFPMHYKVSMKGNVKKYESFESGEG